MATLSLADAAQHFIDIQGGLVEQAYLNAEQAYPNSNSRWVGFLDALGEMESHSNYGALNTLGYAGMYQFGNDLLNQMNFYTGIGAQLLGVTNQSEYLKNPIAQDFSALIEFSGFSSYKSVYKQAQRIFTSYGFTADNFNQLVNHTFTINYIDATTKASVYSETVDFTPAGISAAAHLMGAAGVAEFMVDVWNSCFNVAPDVQASNTANLLITTSTFTKNGKTYTHCASYPDGNWISDGNNIPISTYIGLLQKFNIDDLINSAGDLASFNNLAATLISYDRNFISDYLTTKKLSVALKMSDVYGGTITSILNGLNLPTDNIGDIKGQVILAGGDYSDSSSTQADLIIGLGSGAQILTGGSGDDVLVGGKGNDVLYGGKGTDTYVFKTGDGQDTIKDSDGLGKVMLDGAQIKGTTIKATTVNKDVMQWVDGSTTYKFTAPTQSFLGSLLSSVMQLWSGERLGTMTITNGSNTITIENFDLHKAATDKTNGYLGIKLPNFATLTADASTTLSLPTDQTANVAHGNTRTLTIAALAGSNVQLSCDGSGTYQCSNGANLLSFENGTVNLTIPEGQDSITVTLVDTGTNTTDSATLTATVTDDSGNSVTSNNLTINFNDLNPTQTTPSNGSADYTYNGDYKPAEFTDELAVGTTIDPAWKWGSVVKTEVGQTHTATDSNGNDYTVVDTYVYTHWKYDDAGNYVPGQPDANRDDSIMGTAGNDSINGGGGNNSISAGQGGNDTLIGGDGTNYITAGDGSNTITVGNATDKTNYITAGKGDNIITGGKGSDSIRVGDGSNLIVGNGSATATNGYADVIIAGNGNNQIYADAKVDLATALDQQKNKVASGQKGDLIAVHDGNNTIVGGTGNDLIYTGAGNNTIVCGPGAVTVAGGVEVDGASLDWVSITNNGYPYTTYHAGIYGTSSSFVAPDPYHGNYYGADPVGTSNDTIFGGTGNSVYWLSNGNNWLDAGGGNDLILAGVGSSTIYGGVGNDTIYGGGGSNYINLESGSDRVILEGGNNTLIGGTGNNYIVSSMESNNGDWATSATDSHNYIYSGSGNSTVWGSGGNDTLISGSQAGTGHATTIYAGDGNEYVVGGDGNDTIVAGAGNDTIYAGDGNATIQLSSSANENSTVYGGLGYDSINGGGGNDVIYAGDGGTADHATTVFAGTGSSTIYGGAGVNILVGGSGNDTLIAGSGTSTLIGGSGTEVMYSTTGNATLVGGSGNDTLYGGSGTDVLKGGSGNALFVAGYGDETIVGGTGKNTYEFDAGFGNVSLQNSTSADTFIFRDSSLADVTVSSTTGSTGGVALSIETSDGGSLTVDGGLDGSVGLMVFADGAVTVDQLMAQAYMADSSVTTSSGTVFTGGNGSNFVGASSGINTFYAQGSDNTFQVAHTNDVIKATANSTNNTVISGVSYALPDNVQNLTLTGTDSLTGTGNSLDNVIIANDGNDTLMGGGGNDTLIGGGGVDTFCMTYGSVGMETVESAQGGIVQLNGIGIGQVQFVQQGNDLLLQVSSGSQSNSMLLRDYYSNPASWAIQDGQNSSSPLQTAVDAAAQRSQAVAQMESEFISQVEQGIILNGGYTLQADGSLAGYRGLVGYGLSATYSVTTSTYSATQYYTVPTSSTVVLPPTSTTSETWSPSYNLSVVDHSGHFNTASITTEDAVVYADPALQSGPTEYGTMWLQATWNNNLTGSWSGGYLAYVLYIYDQGLSTDQYATNLGAQIGWEPVTYSYATNQYMAYGTVTNILSTPGNLQTTGADPQAVAVQSFNFQSIYEIQTINLGSSGQMVYANSQTIVNSNSGNDIIYDAGFAYGGSGNDTMVGGGTLMGGTGNNLMMGGNTEIAGTGNDTLIGGNTMIAGSGNDQIFAGAGEATIQIDPTTISNDLVGGSGDTSAVQTAIYQSMGIADIQQSQEFGGMYVITGEFGSLPFGQGGGYDFYFTYDQIPSMQGEYQWLVDYINNNPDLISYIQPLPSIDLPAANDFQALATYYEQGIIPQHTVTFGQGVTPSDLHLSWGVTVGSISGLSTDPQLRYTTLNISWGADNQSVQVMIPHFDDPLGSGVSQFTFADGSILSMADMISMAPVAPTFDPQLFQYQQGMGIQIMSVDSGYTGIAFGPGITSSQITLGLGSLMVRVGDNDDVIHIQGFDPTDALAPNAIQSFRFSDGTSLSYEEMLSRGFDIYGTSADELLTGTNLDNRIYGIGGNDTLIGSGENDTLVSGVGLDTLIGGTGNETFVVNDSGDVIVVDPNAASNSIVAAFDYVLPDYVQNLTLSGTDNLVGTGNSLDNVLTSNSGIDTLIGGTGNVTFVVNNSADVIIANPNAASNTVLSSVDFVLPDNLSTLTLIGNGNLTATGNDLDDVITGNAGIDTLIAGSGNDTLIAGTGGGTMIAGAGHDTFVLNANSGQQTIVDTEKAAGDTLVFGDGISAKDLLFKQEASDMLVTFSPNGSVILKNFDLFNTDTPPSYFSSWEFADGSSISITCGNDYDGPGSFGVDQFDAQGSLIGSQWAYNDGTWGNSVYGLNGSETDTYYNADGSYERWVNDGLSNYSDSLFNAAGVLLSDSWSKSDGSYGSDVFNADGSGTGNAYYPDGTTGVVAYDGHSGVVTTRYDSSGTKLSDNWTKADGSYGSDTFNADGSGSGVLYKTDGSYGAVEITAQGDVYTTYYDSNGAMIGDAWQGADGSSYTDTYYQDGSVSDTWIEADGSHGSDIWHPDGSGNGVAFDVNSVKIGDWWRHSDGSAEDNTYYADGSSSGTSYDADGSYSSYVNDGHGTVTTTSFDSSGNELGYNISINDGHGNVSLSNYDATGIKLGDNWTKTDGSHGSDTFNADGSSSGSSYNADGSYRNYVNDGLGSATSTTYDANGNLLSDSWSRADGTHGKDTFNTDGSSRGISYAAYGSYSRYTNNGVGNVTTTYFDAAGVKLEDSWSKADGSSGTDLFDQAGRRISGTVVNPAKGYSETFDNTILANGDTEAVVNYTYTDGSTYSTDTVKQVDGSYQQSWNKSDGSSGTTNYVAATGEKSGTIVNPAKGFVETFDNTILANGDTEAVLSHTYTDGSTYSTDTVKQADGSYQQSWSKSDGSSGTTNYVAATGEKSGTIVNPIKGYSEAFDNTILANGDSEAVVNYTYTDGSTYSTDTVKQADGSYQQSWSKSDGSSGTTNYVAATGEKSGTIVNPAKGFVETFDNTILANGDTEAVVNYTYIDGSTYTTDTVKQADGSYQQSWSKSDGSSGTTNYVAATGEKSGTIVNPIKGYSEIFDNTVLPNGDTEAVVNYTYTDGSTYSTDTVKQADGSYQQSWSKSDGSSGTTSYNAVTLEKSGTIDNPVKGYSEVFNNTILANGDTEAVANYTYTDGSTYSIDTVKAADGSYTQIWSKSNGTSGSKVVDSTGVLIADSQVYADGRQAVDAAGNHLMLGTTANNSIKALGTGNEIMIGGAGNDTLTTGPNTNIVAFNKGDGKDSLYASTGVNNTLSLGGSFAYSDLTLQHNGNDLVLNVGGADSITFKGWYTGNNQIVDLQVVASAMSDFNPGSSDTLRNSNVEEFDFQQIVSAFDQAKLVDPGLSAWNVANALLDAHLASSDNAALGGDLAYEYGLRGNLSGMSVATAQNTLSSSEFATAPQVVSSWQPLNTGVVQIK